MVLMPTKSWNGMELAEKCAVGTDIRGDKSEPEEEEEEDGHWGAIHKYLLLRRR